jgi:hypothetical protein
MSEVNVTVTNPPPIEVEIVEPGVRIVTVPVEVPPEVIEVEVSGTQGEKGDKGDTGEQGPAGADADLHYRHEQAAPATTWEIAHNLGKSPSIRVIDSSGQDVEGDYEDIDLNNVVLYFSAPFSGVAVLN